jgi:anti-sigma regulatory factor (Ser/Thr protein kinase)
MSLTAICSSIFCATGAEHFKVYRSALRREQPRGVTSVLCRISSNGPRRNPMNAMAPTRPTELQLCRVRLTAGPAAAAEARSQVRAAIRAWDLRVDPDVAVLLTSELVTNALRHETGDTVTLAITCSLGQLRVDVYDTSRFLPVLVDAPPDAEAGRGLVLVATMSDEWGYYRTPAGKAVYFALRSQPGHAEGNGRGPRGVHAWGL